MAVTSTITLNHFEEIAQKGCTLEEILEKITPIRDRVCKELMESGSYPNASTTPEFMARLDKELNSFFGEYIVRQNEVKCLVHLISVFCSRLITQGYFFS